MKNKINVNQLQTLVEEVYTKHKSIKGGKNASYIPFLESVPSELCGLCVTTADGDVFSVGDTEYPFAIESISKICTLSLLLEEMGTTAVRKKIGAEPTGLPFNSVMALTEHKDKPLTPLVNAGAMASVSLLKADNKEDRWNKILKFQQQMIGTDVTLSEELNESEQSTNFHNRAIAWLLYAAGNCFCDPMEACEVYTRQCSTLLNCRDLSMMGATLANNGVNPKSGKQIISPNHIPCVLAEMTMEGLYTYSGDWAYSVGLPSKSGVGGGLLSIAPGKLSIAAFSPPIDGVGNSVRGQKIIADLAKKLSLNLYHPDY